MSAFGSRRGHGASFHCFLGGYTSSASVNIIEPGPQKRCAFTNISAATPSQSPLAQFVDVKKHSFEIVPALGVVGFKLADSTMVCVQFDNGLSIPGEIETAAFLGDVLIH